MTRTDNNNRQKEDFRLQSPTVWWSWPILLGVMGIGLLLLFSLNVGMRPLADNPSGAAARHVPEGAKRLATAQTMPALGSASHLTWRRPLPEISPDAISPAERQVEHRAQPREPAHLVWALNTLASQVKSVKVITDEGATDIKRMLRELRDQGAAAIPAIDEFLRQGEDVDFTKISGSELVGHRTLRQAMIDTLRQIGGSAAVTVSLAQFQQTTDPIEVAMLARSLEKEEPGVHREEVIQAISNALQRGEPASARELPDVSPLFDLLRDYGGEQAVAVLERSVPQWGEYALIALAGVPQGAGIPSLIALAGAPNLTTDNPALPFQILAQATVRYPEAGDVLVNLARAGQIPDQAWGAMAEALGGKHLQFSGKMFDGTPLAEEDAAGAGIRTPLWKNYYIQWLNVHYEQDVVLADWSAEQIDQQLALIDDLLKATSSSAAVRALQQVRAALEHRPL